MASSTHRLPAGVTCTPVGAPAGVPCTHVGVPAGGLLALPVIFGRTRSQTVRSPHWPAADLRSSFLSLPVSRIRIKPAQVSIKGSNHPAGYVTAIALGSKPSKNEPRGNQESGRAGFSGAGISKENPIEQGHIYGQTSAGNAQKNGVVVHKDLYSWITPPSEGDGLGGWTNPKKEEEKPKKLTWKSVAKFLASMLLAVGLAIAGFRVRSTGRIGGWKIPELPPLPPSFASAVYERLHTPVQVPLVRFNRGQVEVRQAAAPEAVQVAEVEQSVEESQADDAELEARDSQSEQGGDVTETSNADEEDAQNLGLGLGLAAEGEEAFEGEGLGDEEEEELEAGERAAMDVREEEEKIGTGAGLGFKGAQAELLKMKAPLNVKQSRVLAALQSLKVIDSEVKPEEVCTRREYARWLLRASKDLASNPTNRVEPSMYVEGVTELAFEDVTSEDPDFAAIQGLAEAGLIRSQLSFYDASGDEALLEEEEGPIRFNPDGPLTRQDLIGWKMALEHREMPAGSVEALEDDWGLVDAIHISEDALSAVAQDLTAGEDSVIAAAFGYNKRFQPNAVVTHQQAAASLAVGPPASRVAEEWSHVSARWRAEEEEARRAARRDESERIAAEIEEIRRLILVERRKVVAAEAERVGAEERLREGRFALGADQWLIEQKKGKVEDELHGIQRERIMGDKFLHKTSCNIQAAEEEIAEISATCDRLKKEICETADIRQQLEELKQNLADLRLQAEKLASAKQEQVERLRKGRQVALSELLKVRPVKGPLDLHIANEGVGGRIAETLIEKRMDLEALVEARRVRIVTRLTALKENVEGFGKKITTTVENGVHAVGSKARDVVDTTSGAIRSVDSKSRAACAKVVEDWKMGVRTIQERFGTS